MLVTRTTNQKDDRIPRATVHAWLQQQGYIAGRAITYGRVAAITETITGNGRMVVGTFSGVDQAFCYTSVGEAITALCSWDVETDEEPDGWFRCVTDGRRRPGGDKSKEYIAP